MASWKLGYPNGLDSVASEAAGEALYNAWSVSPLTLSTKVLANRIGGQATGVTETSISDTGRFITSLYNGGLVKILSGAAKGEVYKVVSNTTGALTLKTGSTAYSDGVRVNDYFEVVTGSTTFVFESRNPHNEDIKTEPELMIKRYPLYDGGLAIARGRKPEDLVVQAILNSEAELKMLQIMANLKMDYSGNDGTFTTAELAPLILETGTHDEDHQFLVHILSIKRVRSGARGSGIIEVQIHLQQCGLMSYRGY